MRDSALPLDPYTKEVSILIGDKVHVCSYREAIENPRFSAFLLPGTRELIALNLEAAK